MYYDPDDKLIGPRPRTRSKIANRIVTVICTGVEESTKNPFVVFEFEDTQETFACPLASWPEDVSEPNTINTDYWSRKPLPGTVWKHFKGGVYNIVCNAFHVETGEHFVIYRSRDSNQVWMRSAESWFERVQAGAKSLARFSPISKVK